MFIYLVLVIVGLLGNVFYFDVLLGIQILFGSIFTLVILRTFSFVAALVASAVVGGVTLLLWDHPYALIILLLETVFVGLLLRRFRDSELVIADMLYWLLIGMPLVWVAYRHGIGMPQQAALVVMLKQGINGIFNAILASILVHYTPLGSCGVNKTGLPRHVNRRLSLRTTFFQPIICSIILAMFTFLYINGKKEFSYIEKNIHTKLKQDSVFLIGAINTWLNDQKGVIQKLVSETSRTGIASPPHITPLLSTLQAYDYDYLVLGVCDAGGRVVAASSALDHQGQPVLGTSLADRGYFKQIQQSGKTVVSGVLQGRISNQPVVIIASPLMLDGAFSGCVFGSLSLKGIGAFARSHSQK